ncbi:MAG TPA: hypothetical protein VK188_14900, partial [Holophaga sp.]|nr:hypothetical protein [Holophaga sp.]
MSNHEVIEALEKRLNIQGKSHSSNLTDDQVSALRRVMVNKGGSEETAPARPAPPPVRIVKPAQPPTPA